MTTEANRKAAYRWCAEALRDCAKATTLPIPQDLAVEEIILALENAGAIPTIASVETPPPEVEIAITVRSPEVKA